MASEARRGLIRISSNYIRLFASVLLGLVFVRLVLLGTGNDGWGLIALLGSTIGIGALIEAVVRNSMIRELGAAFHSGDDDHFRCVYNSAIALTAGVSLLSVPIFVGIWLLLPYFEIPDDLMGAARWMVAAKGVETVALTLLSAPYNMYKVTERMVAVNVWLVLERVDFVVTAAFLFVFLGIRDAAHGITLYAIIASSLYVAIQVSAVALIMFLERRLIPAPARVRGSAIRSIIRVGGWNFAVIASTNLYDRIAAIIMNLAFGLWGSLVFGIALQLTSYVRMLATGMTEGMDAVSARLSTRGSDDSVRMLVHHSTRLHAMAAFPAAVGMWILAGPFIEVWIGDRLEDPVLNAPPTVTLIRVMMLGLTARAIAEGWKYILYGAGHISRYAPIIVVGGIANPILALVLLAVLPDPVRYTAAAWAFTICLAGSHMGVLPFIARRLIGISYGQMMRPMLRPLVVSLVCAPILLAGTIRITDWSLWKLALVGGSYAIVYAALCWIFVVERSERERFTKGALRHLFPPAPTTDPDPGP